MAPIWTPPNFESIIFVANAWESGTDASAILPKSRLVNSIRFLPVHFCLKDVPFRKYTESGVEHQSFFRRGRISGVHRGLASRWANGLPAVGQAGFPLGPPANVFSLFLS